MAVVLSHTLVILNVCPYYIWQHANGDNSIQGYLESRVRTRLRHLEESANLENLLDS